MNPIKNGSKEGCTSGRLQSIIKSSSALALATLFSLSTYQALADEFPPACSKPDGGQGNTSTTGINFNFHTAHVGDTVQLFPTLGMVIGACQAQNATGIVYTANGLLVKFLDNVTLDPGAVYQCPTFGPPCAGGPYNVTITPALVGATVNSPGGSVAGVPNVVRALQWSFSSHVRTGDPEETLDKLDTASINIVTPCIKVVKQCDLPVGKNCFGPSDNVKFKGYVTNCGDINLTNVIVIDSRTGKLILNDPVSGLPLPVNANGGVSLNIGAFATYTTSYTPTLSEICGLGSTNTVTATGTDTTDIGGPNASVTNSTTAVCPICINPCIAVTKLCNGPIVVGGTQTISGVVTNCGDLTLTNIVVTDNILGAVTNVPSLAPGASFSYSKSFTATCNANTNIVTATANSICGGPVQSSAQAVCAVTSTPCIAITKNCTTNLVGTTQTITGVVTNCGNITLTNIIVTDNIVGAVTNISSLPPGASTTYSKSFTAVCGGNVNTVTAVGTSTCGQSVTNSASATCVVFENPCITVTKNCNGPIVVGGTQTISGVVSNCGNVNLTNIVVTDNILGAVTNIASLPVGGTLVYSKSFTATCNANTNTVTATANSICGTPVQASAQAVCAVTSTPCIAVTKNCTTNLAGTTQTITGVVTNCGNITLTNIIVTDNIVGAVTNIASLAPGASTTYSKSFTAVCGGNVNTVTAIGTSTCGQNVTNSATATCVVFENPCITVTKNCNGPIVVGGTQTISGVVSNCGNVNLTNIVLVDNILGGVTNIASLPVGATLVYSKSFTATCNANTNTVTATANSTCGTPVQASAQAVCAVTSTPCIAVTKICTTNLVGTTQTISGVVSNCGNITLTNIIVSDNIVGAVTNISSLAPGASTTYSKSFTAVCGGNINTVTAIGTSTCGQNVTNSATASCVVTENPCIAVTKNCTGPIVVGSIQTISGVISNCGNVTLTNVVLVDNVLGAVTNIASLPVGGTLAYTKSFTADCVGNTNTVTATANSICGTPVHAQATAPCLVTQTPCISVTKICNPTLVGAGGTVNFSGVVSNCGNVTLTNVTLFDTLLGVQIASFASLPVGGSQPYSTNYTTRPDLCTNTPANLTFTNTVVASGLDACDGRQVQSQASCTFRVDCPKICVTKEVACFIGTNAQGAEICGTFGKLATGVQGDTQNPAFCYRITVTNCGLVSLTNVTVVDDKYGDLTSNFNLPGVFAPGGTATFLFKVELDGASPPSHVSIVTNTVVASGQSASSGITVTAQDKAVAQVIPAAVTCQQLYTVDNGAQTNCVKIDITTGSHVVVTYITIHNAGLADLINLQITNDVPNPCSVNLTIPFLAAGQSTNLALCTNANYTCTTGPGTLTVTVSQYAYANVTELCAHDIDGKVIVVRSECPGCIQCTQPNACRVTGGGRQDDPLVYPHNVRYVTHGGQVGAPTGNRVCVVTSDFFLGNPCIHGRWTHVRHMQGGLEGNFHARFYDTLDCVCLDTNLTSTPISIPGVDGAANQTYNNLVYGKGTVINGLCNPDDHKVAGPEPRPAPANKIVFTGVGDWADPNGRRAPRATLFRVDIEDRSEPGGSHPKGGTPPPDRYRIRIWVLSDAELAALNGGGPDQYLLNFRNAISACNGLNVQDGASVPNGTAAFSVRAPDIDDGGELERGNHQIHPAIMNCDPNNPTGPGLPKP